MAEKKKLSAKQKKIIISITAAVAIVGITLGIVLKSVVGKNQSGPSEGNKIEDVINPGNTQSGENGLNNGSNNGTGIVTPETPEIPETPETPEEQYTESQYKQMCETKLGEVIKQSFDKANERYSRSLTNYSVAKIDKTNGIVYGYGDVNDFGNNIFVTTTMKNASIFNKNTYEGAWENVQNITLNDCSPRIYENIATQSTSSSYNEFLNTVVKDQGFKDVLSESGISINSEKWEDVATVVNAKVYDDNNIDISFIDLNNSKTVTVKVNAKLNLEESTNVQSMVTNFISKNKSYTIVESKNFSTFKNVIESTPELGE